MEVITISSTLGIMETREKKFQKTLLFPNKRAQRAFQFDKKIKKYVFLTARVHPGEIPGTHVLNGIIKYLLFS